MSGSTNGNIIGSGSDTIVLNMAEDQAAGVDGEFTVNVDGQQIGGVETVTASQSAGQTEPFTFEGNYAPGSHAVTVTFVNNFIFPGSTLDRNVYVDGVTYDGQTVSSSSTGIYQSPFYIPNSTEGTVFGNAQYNVNDTTSVPAGAPSTPTTSPAPVSVGSGPDTLVLNMAEDPYAGDAQFTVTVDGQQVGGTLTTTANVEQGQFQEFDIQGNFGPGTHTIGVTFLNDTIGGYYPAGTPGLPLGGPWAIDTEDRNLYVMGASLDGGAPAGNTPWEQSSSGSETFSVTAGSNGSATDVATGLFGSNGAAVGDGNASINESTLSVGGSSSGMTFVASPTTTTTGTSSSGTSSDTSGSGSSTTDTSTSTTTAATSAATTDTTPAVTPTTQDFTSATTTSTPAATTTSTTSAHANWLATHPSASGISYHHHG